MNILQDIGKKDKEFLGKFDSLHKLDEELENYLKECDNFLEGGSIEFFRKLSLEKENVEPAIVTTNKRRGRSKKPVLADITETNILSNTFNIKKEKISDIQDASKNSDANIKDMVVEIKREIDEMPAPTKLPPRKKKIKTEVIEPPKRSTRTRTRAKKQDDNDDTNSDKEGRQKSSDVIIQNTTITTIDILEDSERDTETESEVEKNGIINEVETRSTRSKMKKQNKPELVNDQAKDFSETKLNNEKLDQADAKTIRNTRTKTKQKKRARSDSIEEPSSHKERKKSKAEAESNAEQECNGSIQTEYEDAVSMIENNQGKSQNTDATYIASVENSHANQKANVEAIANSTVIIENPKIALKDQVQVERTPPKHINKGKGTKQIFSPFEKTSLKKKVEAFEKLGADASSIPTRVTRTKKRAQKKDSSSKDENEVRTIEEEERAKITEKEKPKVFTPITSKFLPKVCSTSKINKLHPNSDMSINNESILSVKSSSALKASQAEFREREKRRQEKEREALKKREALLQAQTEEKRRKREEKQQKAQQQREMLEKEKLKQLEAQKIKEEKYKQAMAEREEKWQKQKEEAEKKRLMAKKKANELLKEREEVIRIAEQKKFAEMKTTMDKQSEMAKLALKQKMERAQTQQPLYKITKPPLLPTHDCYDSDDPEFKENKRYEPLWSKSTEIKEMQLVMITAGEAIKNTFFCRQVQTPDLTEIFEIIDPRKLKRTSSAIWRKPPRYTLMPTFEDHHEFSEDSD